MSNSGLERRIPTLATEGDDSRSRALAFAGLFFACLAPLTYGILRAIERARAPLVDPGQILASTHMAFIWRTAVATWFGFITAGVAYVVVRSSPPSRASINRVAASIVAIGLGLAAAAYWFP